MAGTQLAQNMTPMLAVHDCAAALDFYRRAFGASEVGERYEEGGKIGHAEFQIAGVRFMIADEFPEHNASPRTLGGTPVILHLVVADVDSLVAKAEAEGAEIVRPPGDTPFGRIAKVRDPFGHVWMFNGPVRASDG